MLLLVTSAGREAVYRQTLRMLSAQSLPDRVQRELIVSLENSRPGTLEFGYEAGFEAGLRGEKLLTRAAAVYFLTCAVNVGDDLSDGDCTYLRNPNRAGPCVQSLLRNMFFHILFEARLPHAALSAVARHLIAAAAAQRIEIDSGRWDSATFRTVADGIGGQLFSAYLRVLWCNTRLQSRATAVGKNIGRALIVVEDAESNDRRYMSMPPSGRREVLAWALDAVKALGDEHLRCLEYLLRPIEPALKALADLEGGVRERRAVATTRECQSPGNATVSVTRSSQASDSAVRLGRRVTQADASAG